MTAKNKKPALLLPPCCIAGDIVGDIAVGFDADLEK